jgi:hypothetical protein
VGTYVFTYSAAISAGAMAMQWQQALGCFLAVMPKAGVVTDVITFSAAFSA